MNKKVISFLLIICMLLSFMPTAAFADTGSTDSAVAQVGNDKFNTLQQAITTDSAVDYSVKLLTDIKEDISTTKSAIKVTLDLNSKTLASKTNDEIPVIKITSGSSLTIAGNGVVSTSGSALLLVEEKGTLTIENGTFSTTASGLSLVNNGTVTIDGGTFNNNVENKGTMTIDDGTFEGTLTNNGTLEITSDKCKFKNNPSDLGAKIPENNKFELQNGYYVLVPTTSKPEITYVAQIGDTGYTSLREAVNAATPNATIKLLKNVKEYITITDDKEVTLDFGDYALTGYFTNTGTLTITSGIFNGMYTSAMQNAKGAKLTINNGTFNEALTNDGTVTINNGTFNEALTNKGTVNINGGTFKKALTNDGTVTIFDGYFAEKPENVIIGDENKEFTQGTDKYWTLTDKKPVVDPEDPTVPEEPVIVPEPEIKVDTEGAEINDEDKGKVETAVRSIAPTNTKVITEAAKNVEIPQEVKDNAAQILINNSINVTDEDTVSVVVAPYFDIKVEKYDAETANVLTLDITPKYVLKVTTATDSTDMNEHNTATVTGSETVMEVTKPITFTIALPDGFTANFVKHVKDAKDNYAVYYYPVEKVGENNNVSFTILHGFSEFTFLTDNREATIRYTDIDDNSNEEYSYEIHYTAANIGDSLPYRHTANIDTTFAGWKIEGEVYTVFTEELLDLINNMENKTVNATVQHGSSSGGSSGGGSSSSSGGPATSKAVVSSPDNDVKVTYTGVASSLINNVEKAVADNKNVQVVGGSNSAIKVSAKKGDTVLNSFDDPLTVTVPVIKSAVSSITSTSKLTLAKVNKAADGKITFTYMGGNYNEAKNNFTAYVDEPGEYVLLFDNNVQKIALQVGKKANTVNGRTVTNDVAPVIVNSRTMIPLRFVSESLGGQVSWTEATRAVTIKMNGLTMNMTIDQKIDGFDTAPVIRDGRTMVPVRYIAEKLGANVIYVPNTQEIVVVK